MKSREVKYHNPENVDGGDVAVREDAAAGDDD